ncbi:MULTISPECIES: hypothetical protein [unclassified Frankia]|uniref:hypothetical protein n=1 Tax=unclassified Frankia TaxID=2632575 RepID=UPI002AD5197B|nr:MULTISPECIES: hypothetical protein [unclassified Frankia]
MATNLYDDLKKALQELKDLLESTKTPIQQAVKALKALNLPIGNLITQLSDLLAKLQKEINNLNVNQLPVLSDISGFTGGVRSVLDTAKKLLPDQAADVDEVLRIVDVVGSLPSLKDVQEQIDKLITAILSDLTFINS